MSDVRRSHLSGQQIIPPMREDLPAQLSDADKDFWKDWREAPRHQRDAMLAKLVEQADAKREQMRQVAERTFAHMRDDVEGVRIVTPPAGRLLERLRFLMTRNAFETMIAPFIAQEREEHYQAMQRGEHEHARWIIVRMYLLIGYNALSGVASSLVSLIVKIRSVIAA